MHTRLYATVLALATLAVFAGCASARTWRQSPANPVLRAALPWEGSAVYEPTVIWDHGRYRMWYSARWGVCDLGYAESRDGIHWRKHPKPLLHDACRNTVTRTSWGFYVFTVDHAGSLHVATSKDGIHLHAYVHPAMSPKPGSWDPQWIDNVFAWHGRHGWHLLYEAADSASDYQIALASGNPGEWRNAAKPLTIPGDGQSRSGPWLDGSCLYYHASPAGMLLPTSIYRSCTHDFVHWTPGVLELSRTQPWEVDQVADPSIAHAPGKPALMAFDGENNPAQFGAIGVAWLR